MTRATKTEPQRQVSILSRIIGPSSVLDNLYQRIRSRLEHHLLLSLSTRHRDQAHAPCTEEPPLPPPFLREWVAGTKDVDWFLESGRRGRQTILSILDKHNIQFDDLDAVLDFGCGCGRVLRHLYRHSAVQLHGSDINRMAIAWCDMNFNFAEFGTNRLEPPTRYKQYSFDLIYAFSVFTHLPEPLQMAWMREMYRLLKPGGHLIMTVHGDYYLSQIPQNQREDYDRGKLVVTGDKSAGMNACAAYHPEPYVRRELAKDSGFRVIDFFPQGALGNPYQDAYLLQS
jgi:SAM-dependent methyltransferase